MPALIVIAYIYLYSSSARWSRFFFVGGGGGSTSRFSLGAGAQPQPNSITHNRARSQLEEEEVVAAFSSQCWLGCSQADCAAIYSRTQVAGKCRPHLQVHAQMPIIGPAVEAEDVIRPFDAGAKVCWTPRVRSLIGTKSCRSWNAVQ